MLHDWQTAESPTKQPITGLNVSSSLNDDLLAQRDYLFYALTSEII